MTRTLLLIPSDLERRILLPDVTPRQVRENLPLITYQEHGVVWALCGIGPAAAAATSTRLLTELKPDRVILTGLAGAFEQSCLELRDIVQAQSECFADLGYRDGKQFHNLDRMGLPMLTARDRDIGCRFPLQPLDSSEQGHAMITVGAITNSRSRAEALWREYQAGVENMEGAAVALSCLLQQTPFYEVRVISNRVGPRQVETWQIKPALERLRAWLLARLAP